MAYFNYHAQAKKLIESGHCTHAELMQKHNQISPALVLFFDNHKPMPIREYKWHIYFALLQEHNIEVKDKTNVI